MFWIRLTVLIALTAALASAQAVLQDSNPGSTHQRIEKVEVRGRRVALQSLKGTTLFTASAFDKKKAHLLIHFHGAPWLVERHIAATSPQTALITVQIGAGSSAYGRPFADPELFPQLVREAGKEIGLIGEWKSITLTGFSAGYGAIRAILRQPENYRRVSGVLLMDGIHASYEPEGKAPSEGGVVADRDLDSFVAFAKDAAAGKKRFVLAHSEIVPPNYASTTECVDHLLGKAGLKRTADTRSGPMGMRQLSSARKRGFHVFGYAGDAAPDHVDHLHAMPFWFRSLGIE